MPDSPEVQADPPGTGGGPTRRRFLFWVAATVLAGTGLAFYRRTAILRWFVATPLGHESTGRIGDAATATLAATVVALLDERVERTHYAEFFRWRAANVTGMRALYEHFAVRLDAGARQHGASSFVAAPREVQRHILAGFRLARGKERAVRSVFARDDQRFARYVVRDVFRVFSRTDAWVLCGYAAWPGMPRAIASLRRDGSVS
jgi:hypothetical protein